MGFVISVGNNRFANMWFLKCEYSQRLVTRIKTGRDIFWQKRNLGVWGTNLKEKLI